MNYEAVSIKIETIERVQIAGGAGIRLYVLVL
jgi:hypothetical protein